MIRIDTHKLVIAAACEFFATKFESNFADSSNNEYIVVDLDGPTLQKIVDYCYTGEITLDEKCVYDIVKAANFLRFLFLEDECDGYLRSTLAMENVVYRYMLADSLVLSILKTKSLGMICKNFKQIATIRLEQLDAPLFLDVLKSDKIEASEELVFSQLQKWVEHDEEERSKCVPELIKHIQLNRINGNVSFI